MSNSLVIYINMKKAFILLAVIILSLSVKSQQRSAAELELKARIIKLEKAGWDAWKNKNSSWFRYNTTSDCVWINSEGVINKEEMMRSTETDCAVSLVALDDFKFIRLNTNTVLLTYTAIQEGSCGKTKLAPKIRASVNYVKRGSRWLEAFYMETPVAK